MLDERFLHPLQLFNYGTGRTSVAFRVRNHPIPCTTRRMKTMRKQARRRLRAEIDRLTWFEEDGQLTLTRADKDFFDKYVRPRIGQPPVYGSISGREA